MNMKLWCSIIIPAALLCLFCSTAAAFNITRILSNFPDFGSFNGLLSKSGVAQEINSRQTITVLAVRDGSLGELPGKSMDMVEKILSGHVILDYYDIAKLNNLRNRSSILTTLYQTSGDANGGQGFLNVTKTDKGIMFGSAVKGAPLPASLQGSVTAKPYNISVLQVSAVIEPPSLGNVLYLSPPPPPPSPSASAPKSANSPAESPPDDDDDVPTAAPAPAADADADADADAPAASPPQPDSSTPGDNQNETPAAAPTHHLSASSRMHVDGVAAVMLLMACVLGN